MLKLTKEEIALLQELVDKGELTISGNRSRQGLRRIVDVGYVTEGSLNLSVTMYAITDAGRAALRSAKGGPAAGLASGAGKWPDDLD
jgi:hypothetical protein